jgi:Integrase core domain
MRPELIQSGGLVENAYAESLNERLIDEGLKVGRFVSLADARQKLAKFRQHL